VQESSEAITSLLLLKLCTFAYVIHSRKAGLVGPNRPCDSWGFSTLKVAWVFHTGDISDGRGTRQRSGSETTPILVDGALFLTTPFNRVIALDPETGKQRWAFDPKIDENWQSGDGLINCGLATWLDTARAPGTPVVIAGDKSGFLYVLNRDTGVPVFPVEEQVVPNSDAQEALARRT
jgi:quinoprotein glucose dehydrogenase